MLHEKPFRRAGPTLLTGLALLLLALLAPAGAKGEIYPSSDVLVPYFEVDLADTAHGLTTLFAVANDSSRAVDARFSVYTNWGIPVLELTLRLDADEVRTVNLKDWILFGNLPGRTLSEAELAHLQAALSGKPSPQDSLYYGTEVERDVAIGYVTIRTLGAGRPDVLWGDYYKVEPDRNYFQAETLVNLDRSVECTPDCRRHAIRFLNAGFLTHGTQLVIWTGRRLSPSPTPQPVGDKVAMSMEVYDEPGHHVEDRSMDILAVQIVEVDDLDLRPQFGWLDIRTEDPSFIAEHLHSTTASSAELHAYCLPEESLFEGPLIRIEKLVNGEDADMPPGPSVPVGSALAWTFEVTNAGTVPLTWITVSDNSGLTVTCPGNTLGPGEFMICTAQSSAAGCQKTNIATVTALAPDGTEVSADDPAHYFGQYSAALQIEKKVNGETADERPGPTVRVGSPVQWTYEVSNTGNAPLANVAVTDDRGVAVTCPKATLEPAESMTCTASGTAAAGQYDNIGTVTGQPPCGSAVTASDPAHYFGWVPAPAIDIEKLTNGEDADTPPGLSLGIGQAVQWTYVVTNTGDVPLSPVTVTDDRGVAVSCPKTALQPGESMTCTGSGVATACLYENIGTATGTPPEGQGPPVTDQDPSHYYGWPFPSIAIEKRTNGEDADTPPGPSITVGAPVQWTYVVTNTGDVALTSVTVADDQGVAVTCPKTTLAPAESMTCTASGTATLGQYRNVATVNGIPPCGAGVFTFDLSHYFGVAPAIAIEKLINGEDADACPGPTLLVGSPALWTYVVTNTGDVTLSQIAVTDDQGVTVTCPKTTLTAGESMTCTATGTAAAGQHSNIGTATGKSPQNVTVTAQDSACYTGHRPQITLEKRVNGQDADTAPGITVLVGSTLSWTYVVTNTGDVRLTNVRVSDDQGLAISCPKTALEPGESMTCTATSTAAAGQHMNVATVAATPPTGPDVTATDPANYEGVTAAISIEKLTNGNDADAPPGPTIAVGGPVLWTYVVTNTGEVALSQVTVTDNRGVAVSCPKTTLDPAESMTCSASGTAVAGQYSNIGTANGTPSVGGNVSDQDPSHYFGWTQTGNQGCTPGYWKNHTGSWPPTGYSTGQTVQSVFSEAGRYPALGSATLLDALGFAGGPGVEGAAEILLRAGVAALLNAAHPDVAYPRLEMDVIADVNTALASGDRDTMLALAAALDADNNRGCPLS